MRQRLSDWRATHRVMRSAVFTASALLRAEICARFSSQPQDVWRTYYKNWAQRILEMYGLEIDLVGPLPQPKPGRGLLLLCAHRSPLDVPLLVSLSPKLRFLSRADVEHWPVVGSAAKRARTLFVERGNRRSAVQAVEQMHAALKQGDALAVFPEGRTKTSTVLGHFRTGAFRARAELDIDVWVVAMAYPDGFGWAQGGPSLFEHLRSVILCGPTRVPVAFRKLAVLPRSSLHAARDARKKLQDLDNLLRDELRA